MVVSVFVSTRRNYLDLYVGPVCTCSVVLCILRLAVDLGVNKLHYPLVSQVFRHLACFVGSVKKIFCTCSR